LQRDLLLGRLRGAVAVALDLPSGDSRAVFIALIGLVALAVSGLFPRPAGEGAALSAGALTLIGLWIGLHGHGVSTPEAYTVPLAAVLLAAGAVRYRRNPPTDSASAFGPGLAALLAPRCSSRSSRPRCSSRFLIPPAAPDGCSCCYRSARPF